MCRIDKDNYYLNIAAAVSEGSTCSVAQWGAVIVQDDTVVATGFNGVPHGRVHCTDLGHCVAAEGSVPCRGVSAEANALISAGHARCTGATLYLCGKAPDGTYLSEVCPASRSMIINAGLSRVIVRTEADKFAIFNVPEWVFDDDTLASDAAKD